MKCWAIILTSVWFIFACNNNKKNANKSGNFNTGTQDSIDQSNKQIPIDSLHWQINGIKVYAMKVPDNNSEASISLAKPIKNPGIENAVTFNFQLQNFELNKNTPLPKDYQNIANNKKGQYIGFLLNNGEIEKVRQDSFQTQLFSGNNVITAFLCTSYGVSFKEKTALFLKDYSIGGTPVTFNAKGKHLFYNIPSGTFVGQEAKKVVLDFYLANTKLSQNGDKVRATIDGTEFLLPRWCPYIIEGLKAGKNTIRLELVDKNGNLIAGPFNDSGERTIEIRKQSV